MSDEYLTNSIFDVSTTGSFFHMLFKEFDVSIDKFEEFEELDMMHYFYHKPEEQNLVVDSVLMFDTFLLWTGPYWDSMSIHFSMEETTDDNIKKLKYFMEEKNIDYASSLLGVGSDQISLISNITNWYNKEPIISKINAMLPALLNCCEAKLIKKIPIDILREYIRIYKTTDMESLPDDFTKDSNNISAKNNDYSQSPHSCKSPLFFEVINELVYSYFNYSSMGQFSDNKILITSASAIDNSHYKIEPELHQYFRIAIDKLLEEGLYFPRATSIREAFVLKNNEAFLSFKNILLQWVTEVQNGSVDFIEKLTKEIFKSNQNLRKKHNCKKLSKALIYVALPAGVLEALLWQIPLLSSLISATSWGLSSLEEHYDEATKWRLLSL